MHTRRIPLFALFAANTISFIGDELLLLAIPWFVLQTTGSVTQTGIAAFFETFPIFASAFLGSALVDRFGYKRMSVVSDITSCMSVVLIPLLCSTIGLAFWQLLVLIFLAGFFQAPGRTARSSLVPDLAPLAGIALERVNAASDGMQRVAVFIGASLAGILVAIFGTTNLLWLDAISFALSAALIWLAIPQHADAHPKEGESSYLTDILAGLRFIRQNQLILVIVFTVMITNLLDEAFFAVAQPTYVKHFFGSAVILGVLSSCVGGAAFVSAIVFGAIGHRLPRRLTFALGFVILSLRFFIFALIPSLPALIIANIISGLGAGPLNPIISTVEQTVVPPEMRARVFGTTTAGTYIAIPLGAFLCGYLIQWAGILPSMFVLGTCYLLTTASLLVNPGLKDMGRRPEEATK